MISPSPTQAPPARASAAVNPEPSTSREIKLTPIKPRPGQTPFARAIKAILRPVLKALYYAIRWIRSHKLVTLIAIVLLLASIFISTYVATGYFPLFGPDQVEQKVDTSHMSNDVKQWLVALRDGDVAEMRALEKGMSSPPDPATLTSEYSQSQSLQWTNVGNPIIVNGSDGLADTFIEIDLSANTSSGTASYISYWHFVTDKNGQIVILEDLQPRQVQ